MKAIRPRKAIRALLQQNQKLRRQRNHLALFLVRGGDMDTAVCYPRNKAGLCPYDRPPYHVREEICAACVIRAICEK